jgi:hypothetical protein
MGLREEDARPEGKEEMIKAPELKTNFLIDDGPSNSLMVIVIMGV